MTALTNILENKDVEFVAMPFSTPAKTQPWAMLLKDKAYAEFLKSHNGLFAFDRALHLFGVDSSKPFHDLTHRNDPSAEWRKPYEDQLEGIYFFAEDLFGHLIGFREDEVITFDPESAEEEVVGEDFQSWLEFVDEDTDFATGQSLAQEWSEENSQIPFDSRLAPNTPFVLGGEFAADNLKLMPWDENLAFMAEIYGKIKDLPDGAEVEIQSE